MMVEAWEEEHMGLGADTIEALAGGPYREAERVRVLDRNRIQAIIALRRSDVPSSAIYWVAVTCGQLDVFEAVAEGHITSEEGAWLLSISRVKYPWYVRLAHWLFGRSVLSNSDGEKER